MSNPVRYCAAIASLGMLAGCQTIPEAQEPASTYFAAGTEPFWSFGINDGEMRFRNMDGTEISTRDYTVSNGGKRYTSKRVTAEIRKGPCNDGMSDRTYRDSVSVTVDGKRFSGCGGGLVLPANLAGTKWQLDQVNNVKVQEPGKTEINFDGQRMSATTGCNRMSGSYTVSGNVITFGPVMATKMACPGSQAMQLEAQFMVMLTQPVTYKFTGNDKWELSSDSGYRAILTMVE